MSLWSQSTLAHSTQLLYAGFAQDSPARKEASGTSGSPETVGMCTLTVGCKSGYKIFSLEAVDKLEQVYQCSEAKDVYIVETLVSCNVVALVSLQAPRKLKVCHLHTRLELCSYSYSRSVLAVRLNRHRMVVCLEEALFFYSFQDLRLLHVISETPSNETGLCALHDNYLAYPGSVSMGKVHVFDTIHLRAATSILAHNSPLAALAFDATGYKLATASEKGTVIRVFSIPEGQKLYEFRRGLKRCVQICSLTFSLKGLFLCASSNTETVHVFRLHTEAELQEQDATWTGYLGKLLVASSSYLPTRVTEIISQGRAFATVHLPFCDLKTSCFLATIQNVPQLLVAASNGYLYIYNLDSQDGGECTLLKRHSLGE
ncbi:WD repeat domain phosphoinositide-interacting protein 2-like [Erinaceus europaeus]|uniref:WD repeat domain phosphoinositide-interacting protein 2-like n=1 Tax=Erinaceus europaeus TaxID=9365 RepID=A0A1S3AN61_ERIEU|nr:WD repeat domain phosphoinositide-interacting protein 2-like [Erinaceus europaeus]